MIVHSYWRITSKTKWFHVHWMKPLFIVERRRKKEWMKEAVVTCACLCLRRFVSRIRFQFFSLDCPIISGNEIDNNERKRRMSCIKTMYIDRTNRDRLRWSTFERWRRRRRSQYKTQISYAYLRRRERESDFFSSNSIFSVTTFRRFCIDR